MNLWRLEVLRLWRTRRVVALLGAFLVLGFGEPVLTYYLPELVKSGTNGVKIVLPPTTAFGAMKSFSQEAAQLGTLVVVIVAAACIAVDAHPSLAIFYRTRIRRPVMLLLPRSTATALTAMLALVLGTAAAWYETRLLIGYVSPAALAAGCGLEMLWVAFTVSVVTAWAAIVRSVLAVVGWSIATLLALALLDSISALALWLPTSLSSGIQDLLAGKGGVPWQGVGITVGATLGLLMFATHLTGARTLDR
ncbi:MAG: hypothetical protein WB808_04830 [Candidatus Dormiibacterota bacterium]